MRLLIQRVKSAKVTVENKTVASIKKGVLVFFAAHKHDTPDQTNWLANKLVNLRMFHDKEGKMNLSLEKVEGEILIVSQFTLYANCLEGRRPAFTDAKDPEPAEELFDKFVKEVRYLQIPVQTGVFRAKMEVHLINDGPVTFIIDSKDSKSFK